MAFVLPILEKISPERCSVITFSLRKVSPHKTSRLFLSSFLNTYSKILQSSCLGSPAIASCFNFGMLKYDFIISETALVSCLDIRSTALTGLLCFDIPLNSQTPFVTLQVLMAASRWAYCINKTY